VHRGAWRVTDRELTPRQYWWTYRESSQACGVLLVMGIDGRNVEPPSGSEPMAYRLQEVRPHAPSALAAPTARVIALMALVALGLSEAPVHEPVHGRRQTISVIVTQRSAETSAQRRPI
jgi:hypothetical protein